MIALILYGLPEASVHCGFSCKIDSNDFSSRLRRILSKILGVANQNIYIFFPQDVQSFPEIGKELFISLEICEKIDQWTEKMSEELMQEVLSDLTQFAKREVDGCKKIGVLIKYPGQENKLASKLIN